MTLTQDERIAWSHATFKANVAAVVVKAARMHRALVELQTQAEGDDIDAVRLATEVGREIAWTAWNVDMQSLVISARDLDRERARNDTSS